MVKATDKQAPMKVTRLALAKLVHDPSNPRLHDTRNLESIQRSLGEHGQVEPLVVQAKTMMIIGGNGRMEAMKGMGWTEADCVVLDISDTQARRMSIALNRTSDLAEWDMGVLAKHLDELAVDGSFDPDDLGFSDEEFMRLIADFGAAPLGDAGLDGAGDSDDPTTQGNQATVPAGTQPGHLPSSHVRMIQLFFNEDSEPLVRVWAKRLSEEYGTSNLTDTFYECMKKAVAERGWLEE